MGSYAVTTSERSISHPHYPTQAQIFSGLAVLAIGNAVVNAAVGEIDAQGWLTALLNGLGFSWVFWLASGLAIGLALRAEPTPAPPLDLVVGGLLLLLIALPASKFLAAFAATLVGGWFLVRPGSPERVRAASLILIAVAFNLVWAHLLLLALDKPMEFVDAHLTALLAGTVVHDNIVQFVHGDAGLVIFSGCTSVENVSMALLLWIAIARCARPRPRPRDLLIGLGIFATVVVINLARLTLMAQSVESYHLIHSVTGSAIIDLLITVAGLAWAAFDVRHELFH